MTGIIVVVCLILTVAFLLRRSRQRSRKLPPGPKPDPLIGNLRHVPESYSWLYFTEKKKEYGDILHVSILGQSYVVLNSAKAANDLLVKRSAIYSDRPQSVMIGDIMGMAKVLVAAPYGPYWKTQRRLFANHLNKSSLQEHLTQIQDEMRSYVIRLHKSNPSDFVEEFRLSSVRLLLGVAYAIKVHSLQDDYVSLTLAINDIVAKIIAPGGMYMVDLFPFLRYVPSWFPGTRWKQEGAQWAEMTRKMVDTPWEQTKRDIADGTALPSFSAKLIESHSSGEPYDEEAQKWLSGTMYMAGSDTTLTAFSRFLLAIVLYPEVQRKIQEELDRVVGTNRLPTVDDKDDLPYVEAVIKETLRWNTLTPLGLPRRSMEDDVYDGYRIPKGSIVMANNWAISQDPQMYPFPTEFRPERFIPTDANVIVPTDPRQFVFGFGRRICPGIYFAETVLYTAIVSLLSTSNILKPLDENGKDYDPIPRFAGGIVSYTEPFACRIQPRSSGAFALLSDAVTNAA